MSAGTLTRVEPTPADLGSLLRSWRTRRRFSQLELALEAGISARHLSFVETGRSTPSRTMLLRLADRLDIPLRERNRLLLAAGLAPEYPAHALEDPPLAGARQALMQVLAGHEPYPALAVDRHWNLVASNGALGPLLEGVAPHLLQPPANTMRIALAPDGLAPRIRNLPEWRGHLLHRLERQVAADPDPALGALLEEMLALPGADRFERAAGDAGVMVELHLASDHGELAFFSTVTTFGTALDLTLAELSVEAFFPADAATAEALREAAVMAA